MKEEVLENKPHATLTRINKYIYYIGDSQLSGAREKQKLSQYKNIH